jgi:hypothetical protein
MKKLILAAFVIIAATVSPAIAQKPAVVVNDKPGWHKIAENTVSFNKDRDEVVILGADHFKKIKLKVSNAGIDLRDLEVYYENGGRQDVAVRNVIKEGGETREIDLEGKDRALKKIVLVYKTIPNQEKDKAHVEIYGLK